MAVSESTVVAGIQLIDLATKIIIQQNKGDITEAQALEILAIAHQGVDEAFERFRNS